MSHRGWPLPELEAPIVFEPRFGSWGRDVIRCDDGETIARTLEELPSSPWYRATGAVAQKLVAPRGFDLRIVVARGEIVGAVRRIAAPGEWRTNVALGARREPVSPSPEASAVAIAAAAAIGGDLVGVDLLPADAGTWVVLEVNGAVDFTSAYSWATTSSRPRAPRSQRNAATRRQGWTLSDTRRSRDPTCGRGVPLARTGAGAGTARISDCRARHAARP